MAVPAFIDSLVSGGGIEARGWAIPTATDIALALGIFRVSHGLDQLIHAHTMLLILGLTFFVTSLHGRFRL